MLNNAALSAKLNYLHKKRTESGIMLKNNEMKDIKKVVNSTENRGILIRGNTKKLPVEKEVYLIFLVL